MTGPSGRRPPAWERASARLPAAALLAVAALLASTDATAADPVREAAIDYQVLLGDTVSEIAVKFGIDVATIVRANGLRSADHIVPGQVLTILPVTGITYAVRPGDTLTRIALRFDVEPDAVVHWNSIRDPDLIVLGSELLLPHAKPPPPAPAAPSAPAVIQREGAQTPSPAAAGPVTTREDVDEETLANGRTFRAKITAYTHQAPVGGARGSVTRSGTPVRWGVLAVDPQVIPLGSQVLIEGFDEVFSAEDTGGAVRGSHVEIFYPDHASAIWFGVQTRAVTVLH